MPVMPKPAWGVQVPQHQELCLIPRYSWAPSPQRGFTSSFQFSKLSKNWMSGIGGESQFLQFFQFFLCPPIVV